MILLSIVALFVGPALYHWLRRGGRIAHVLDRVIVAILVVIVGVLLVPEVLTDLGTPACVHRTQRADEFAYTYRIIDPDTKCVFEVMESQPHGGEQGLRRSVE